MITKLFEKHGFKFAQSNAYFKLYNNLGFAVCIDPDLKKNNTYILYDSFRLTFKDLSIFDEIRLSKLDKSLFSLNPKHENSFNSTKDYIEYLIDYFNIHGYKLLLYDKQKI